MIGSGEKRKLRVIIAKEIEERIDRMREEQVDDVVNDAHAIRILLRRGLAIIQAQAAPSPQQVRRSLPTGGRPKDIQLLVSDFEQLSSYHKKNVANVDGVSGAARHALWIAVKNADAVSDASVRGPIVAASP